jgi:hypothetical protein
MTDRQTAAATVPDRVSDRLPIFSALHVLGLQYVEVGRLLGVTTVSVHEWASGKKPLPLVRHLALLHLVGQLAGFIGAKYPPKSRYARRARVAREAAARWAALARDEIHEDTGGVYTAETLERAHVLGLQMLARLEAQ